MNEKRNRLRVTLLAAGMALLVTHVCPADEAADALAVLNKEKNRRLKYQGDRAKYFRALEGQMTKVIDLCESFVTKFPTDKHVLQVKLDEATHLYVRSRIGKNTAADRAKAKSLAAEVADSKAADGVRARARVLLVQMAVNMQSPHWEEAKKEAARLRKDFPNHKYAAAAQLIYAQSADRAGETDRAREAYGTLIKAFPDSPIADKAKGALRRLEVLGKPLTGFSFTDLHGKRIDVADYKGKVVLIDFWATWCDPCRTELPNVKETLAKYGDQGFAVIGVSLDTDKQKLEAFLKKEKMTWPQCFDGKGWKSAMAQRFGINAIPATFLVDRQGVVRFLGVRGETLGKRVKELLAEKE